jgi:hypothetical protein
MNPDDEPRATPFVYKDLRPTDATEAYVRLLEQIVSKASRHVAIPYDEIIEKHNAYRVEHQVNIGGEWKK